MEAAAERALTALSQARGMRVRLRVPAPASSAQEAEQMGLAAPAFVDIELGRGMFRKAGSASRTLVLLLTARGVEQGGAAGEPAAAEALFAGATGVVIGNALYGIEACAALWAGDGVYGYALTLLAPPRAAS